MPGSKSWSNNDREVDVSAPPPPPPQSPPPVMDTTTIGKYIARFRNEKPQPRDARGAARESDFWWTKSPRFLRSPSPPSTWTSGGVFLFPSEEEKDKLAANTDEKEDNILAGDDIKSVDSVESNLRQGLGLWSSNSRQGTSANALEFTLAKTPEVEQSWGSMDWRSFDLEEMEEENEDPEEVIERVRRRLGWGAATSGIGLSTAPRLNPVEYPLSIDMRERRRDIGRSELGRKPPLSPGYTEKSLGSNRSILSRGSMEQERDFGGRRFEKAVSLIDAKNASVVEGKEEGNRSPDTEFAEGIYFQCGNESSMEAREDQCTHDQLPSAGVAIEGLRSNRSSAASLSSTVSKPHDNELIAPLDESHGEVLGAGSLFLGTSESNVQNEEEKSQTSRPISDHDAVDAIAEPPLLPTSSPERPELTSPSSNGCVAGRFHDSSSSSNRGDLIPTETTKTLDNLVSLVMHSWENGFFSTSGRLEAEPRDDSNSINGPAVTPNVNLAKKTSNKTNEDKEAVVMVEIIAEGSVPTHTLFKEMSTQPDSEDEEDGDVPREEDDQIAQMLLERISRLEEALRRIDS